MSEFEQTEKQKMLAGELYLATDPELVAETKRASLLLRHYAQTTVEEPDLRQQILRDLFGKVGEAANIVPPFHCDYGSNIFIGDRFYMNYGGIILDCNTVHIGNDVLCAPYVQI